MIAQTKWAIAVLSTSVAAVGAEFAVLAQSLNDGVVLSPGELVMIATNVVIVAGAFFTLRSQVASADRRINKLEATQEQHISKEIANLIVAPIAERLDGLDHRMDHQDQELSRVRDRLHTIANDVVGQRLQQRYPPPPDEKER